MALYKTYLKLIIKKNRLNYISVIFTIILSFLAVAIMKVYIDSMLAINSELWIPNMTNIFKNIQSVFCMAGITFVLNRYNNIMKSNIRNYNILMSFGATRHDIRMFMMLQVLLLMIITIPFGASGSMLITMAIKKLISEFNLYSSLPSSFNIVTIALIAWLVIGVFLSVLGFKVEKEIKEMSLSQALSEDTSFEKDAWEW